ncbi:hypothetical protein HanHA300_Chr13g0506721 [Helianthus annuus]|nr:hypothetical protein HanHA300_Chr13g0506721 [Helianthus annuus]KAJ0662213.1 hypothetical protein HanLR1_Chr13g0466931 [Helianthus annuus]
MKKSSSNNMVAAADKTRALPVDPNLPRWVCQNCHHTLSITGVDDSTYRPG